MRFRWRPIRPVMANVQRSRSKGPHAFVVILTTAILAGLISPAGYAAVGRLGGAGAVTPTGSATYRIPIEVAAGMNGLKPEVALVYDSQAAVGLAGVGWTLGGFSKIFRCDKSIALDTRVAGITYSTADRFCLDGSPLIMLTSAGTYGGNNTEYRTEVHRYEKIISSGTQGTGPSSFEVKRPDGLTYIYGNDSDSRILAPGTSEVRVWALNTIQDKFGNQVQFAYTNPVTGEYVPDEVTWTGTASGAGPYKLKFMYDDLNSVLASAVRGGYVRGSQWQATQRLKYIDYSFNTTAVHRYTLNYTPGSAGKSQLQNIQQCNGTGADCLPATTFTWQNGSTSYGSSVSGPSSPDYGDAVFGDYDGDGDTDLFIPISVSGTKYWHIALANAATGDFGTPSNLNRIYDGNAKSLDYDGDGRTDLAASGTDGYWHVYISGGTGCSSGDCNTGLQSGGIPADINGDGLPDLLYFGAGSGVSNLYYRLNTGASLGEEKLGFQLPGNYQNHVVDTSSDFDGNGLQDPMVYRCCAYQSIGPVALRTVWDESANPPQYKFELVESLGVALSSSKRFDLNGDGLTDIVYTTPDGSNVRWVTRIGTGAGFSAPVQAGFIDDSSHYAKATFADYDQDGRSDLIRPCGSEWCVHLSTGTTLSSTGIGVSPLPWTLQRLGLKRP